MKMLINNSVFKQSENEIFRSFTNSMVGRFNIMMQCNELSEQENKTKKKANKKSLNFRFGKISKKTKEFLL